MKKLLFGLIAIVLFSVTGNAQEFTKEELRTLLAEKMVSFTSAMRPAFDKAKDFNEFESIVCGNWAKNNTIQGRSLLMASYNLLKNKTTEAHILKSYSGKEMANVALLHNENLKKNIKSTGIEIFGGTTGDFNPYGSTLRGDGESPCRWYQIACWFNEIFGPEAGPTLLNAGVKALLALLGGGQ